MPLIACPSIDSGSRACRGTHGKPFRREKGNISKLMLPFSCPSICSGSRVLSRDSRPLARYKIASKWSRAQSQFGVRALSAWVYFLRLKSGKLYIGTTTDLEQRYKDHCSGKACRTTKFDPSIDVVYTENFESLSDARNREAQVKRWSRAKKEALIVGNIEKLQNLSKSKK